MDTDSDIELLTGDEKEGDGEDTSMTEDWAKFHQQEMEKVNNLKQECPTEFAVLLRDV